MEYLGCNFLLLFRSRLTDLVQIYKIKASTSKSWPLTFNWCADMVWGFLLSVHLFLLLFTFRQTIHLCKTSLVVRKDLCSCGSRITRKGQYNWRPNPPPSTYSSITVIGICSTYGFLSSRGFFFHVKTSATTGDLHISIHIWNICD
jgi:hypothetical protein